MRNKSIFLLIVILLLSLALASCGNVDNKDSNDNVIKPTQKITISFNSSGGNNIESIVQVVESGYELPIPTKAGYNFDGWYNGEDLIKTTGIWTIDKNIELIAKWTARKYSINYVSIGGENSNPSTYTVEDEIVLKPLIWKVNNDDVVAYEFVGWYKDASYNEPVEKINVGTMGDIDLYAKWNAVNIPEEKTNTMITYKAEGFDCDGTTLSITVGDNYVLPQLKKEGYIFVGWKNEDGSISLQTSGIWVEKSQELILVPNWTKRAYSITYVLNEGVNDELNPETFYITDTIILQPPTKENYYFDGWYTDEKFENIIERINEGTKTEITVYAKWLTRYLITYDANGGDIEENQQEVIFDKEYSLPTPKKTGYVFDGWYYNNVLVSQNGVWNIANCIDLKAKWLLNLYSITYDFKGGKANGGNYPGSYNITTDKLQIGIPYRDGYKFIGWKANDKIEYHFKINEGSYGDLSLTAMWHKIDYTYQDKAGIQYLLKDDSTLSVVGYVGNSGSIIIPYTYNGYVITEIGNYAFCGYGDALATLSSSSFFRCDIPDTVAKIGMGAFEACDDLKVQPHYKSEITADEWTSNLIIAERNDHVLDVINGKRPAIGWNKYWIPGQ